MKKRLFAGACLGVWLIVGCQEKPAPTTPEPPVKTKVIKNLDGTQETKTSVPD